MRRDMDPIRNLLLSIESGTSVFDLHTDVDLSDLFGNAEPRRLTREARMELSGHLELLENGGYIETNRDYLQAFRAKLTWTGHDFLDSVREPKVWAETKSRAQKVGSWSAGILSEIAKGVIKGELLKHGFPLG